MTARVTADEITGVFAISPTPATDDANDPAAENTVDVEETKRVVSKLERAGVEALMLTGTSGEAFALTESEWQTATKAAVDARDEMMILAGPTTLNTRTTIRRAKYAAEVGCEGLLLGRPMWCELSPSATVNFYQEVADAVPSLGIVAYDNPGAFKRPISSWEELVSIDNFVGVKYVSLGPEYVETVRQIENADGECTVLQMDAYLPAAMTLTAETPQACWSSSVSCGPAPTMAMMDALEAGNWERVINLAAEMSYSFEPFFPQGNMQEFGRHTPAIVKARMDEAGFMNPGPVRPPDPMTPDAYLEGGRESGRRWRDLAESIENE
jgi:dihydrodipicolinate synthase/N-acetylneuraminate lyase